MEELCERKDRSKGLQAIPERVKRTRNRDGIGCRVG